MFQHSTENILYNLFIVRLQTALEENWFNLE